MTTNRHSKEIARDDLKPGDVVIFQAAKSASGYINVAQSFIEGIQSTVSSGQMYGQAESTHTAICIGKNKKGEPLIASVTESNGTYGYRQETISEMLANDKMQDRTFSVFRAENTEMSSRIAKEAASEKYKDTKWSGLKAVQMILTPAEKMGSEKIDNVNHDKPARDKELKEGICSTFVMHVLKESGYETNLRSNVSPRAIESTLNQSEHFRAYNYSGQNSVTSNTLHKPREVEAAQSGPVAAQNTSAASKNKFEALKKIVDGVKKHCEKTGSILPTAIAEMSKVLDGRNDLGTKDWNSLKQIAENAKNIKSHVGPAKSVPHGHYERQDLYAQIAASQGGGMSKILEQIENRFSPRSASELTNKHNTADALIRNEVPSRRMGR
jgi:hypothetical protein